MSRVPSHPTVTAGGQWHVAEPGLLFYSHFTGEEIKAQKGWERTKAGLEPGHLALRSVL